MNIKKRRKELDLTQMALARECGVSLKTISTWEAGVGKISKKNLVKLERALGVKKWKQGAVKP